MSESESAQGKAARTYNAAADRYDDPANTFWARFGRQTVDRLQLERGERVLDVCCGSGASALPAAERVGPTGLVLGIDLAEGMLAVAREKAAAQGLENLEFRAGDVAEIRFDASFDAVVCVFGIFFLPDMPEALRRLWRAVRPGGRLAVTTWGPRFLEPADSAFWRSVSAVRPDLCKRVKSWERITTPSALTGLLREAGIDGAHADLEPGMHPIPSPQAWWAAVMGSGYRGTVDQLTPVEREWVRAANLDFIRLNHIDAVEANVVYGLARKARD